MIGGRFSLTARLDRNVGQWTTARGVRTTDATTGLAITRYQCSLAIDARRSAFTALLPSPC
jgi:hypothetical protein